MGGRARILAARLLSKLKIFRIVSTISQQKEALGIEPIPTIALSECDQGIKDYIEFMDEYNLFMDEMDAVIENQPLFRTKLDELVKMVDDYQPASCVQATHDHLVLSIHALQNIFAADDVGDLEAANFWGDILDEEMKLWSDGVVSLGIKYGEDW
jgi:hypothetical protein